MTSCSFYRWHCFINIVNWLVLTFILHYQNWKWLDHRQHGTFLVAGLAALQWKGAECVSSPLLVMILWPLLFARQTASVPPRDTPNLILEPRWIDECRAAATFLMSDGQRPPLRGMAVILPGNWQYTAAATTTGCHWSVYLRLLLDLRSQAL